MSLSDAPSWRLRPSAVGRGGGDYPNCRRRPRPPILVAIARRAVNIRPVAGIAVDQGQPGLDLKRNENIFALTPDPFAAANLVDARNQRRSTCSSCYSPALEIGIEEYQEVGPDLFSPRARTREGTDRFSRERISVALTSLAGLPRVTSEEHASAVRAVDAERAG
jgi:hypothetical protein